MNIEANMTFFWQRFSAKLSSLQVSDLELLNRLWPRLIDIIEEHDQNNPFKLYDQFITELESFLTLSPSLKGALAMLEEKKLRFSKQGFENYHKSDQEQERKNQIKFYVPKIANEVVRFHNVLKQEIDKRKVKNEQ